VFSLKDEIFVVVGDVSLEVELTASGAERIYSQSQNLAMKGNSMEGNQDRPIFCR
jgi:hypothetical protein